MHRATSIGLLCYLWPSQTQIGFINQQSILEYITYSYKKLTNTGYT